MRLWSLHPRYLDRAGLTAVWREGLLAQAVLARSGGGYSRHPQLCRFRAAADPASAIGAFLLVIAIEATARGYRFDRRKIPAHIGQPGIDVTTGQLDYEWRHLRAKLRARSPEVFDRWREVAVPDPHPLFLVAPGPIADWERPDPALSAAAQPNRPTRGLA